MRRRSESAASQGADHEVSDETLAFRSRNDADAFVELYQRYYDRLFAVSLRWLRDRDEADDATSDIFFKTLRSIHSFSGGSFRAWLYAIAINTLRDRVKRARTVELPALTLVDSHPGPEPLAIESIAAEEVAAVLSALPLDDALTVIMRAQGYSVADVALAVGRSEAWVRTSHFRTVRRVAARLGYARLDEVNRER